MKRFTIYAIGFILLPLMLWAASCEAQTTYRWPTYQTKFNNPIFTTKESNNYIIFGIEGTTAAQWVLKSALMKVQTVRDTVTIVKPYPVIDCNNYSDYVQTRATLAQTIQERDAANAQLDKLIANNAALQKKYDETVKLLKWSEAERKKYKAVTILIDTTKH